MALGDVILKTRPLKFAFLINANRTEDILQAIQISSFLWGGFLNPLIPYFKKTPKSFSDNSFGYNSTAITKNYINLYDPDIIIIVGDIQVEEKLKHEFSDIEFLNSDEVLKNSIPRGIPDYGIGLFEVFHKFYLDEFKFISKQPPKVIFPKFEKNEVLLLSAIFGQVEKKIEKSLTESFDKLLEIQNPSINRDNYLFFLNSNYIFPRRAGSLYLGDISKRDHEFSRAIIVLNPNSNIDIIDYWNLRANGWNIIPVIFSMEIDSRTKDVLLEFIDENYQLHRFSENFYSKTIILKGRSLTSDDFQKFNNKLSKIIDKGINELNPKVVFQYWMPRMWIDWAEKSDHLSCCEVVTEEKQINFNDIPEDIELQNLIPSFLNKKIFRFGGKIYATEISFNLFGSSKLIAEVIPKGLTKLNVSYTTWKSDVRAAKNSITLLSRHSDRSLNFKIPKAREVFNNWFNQKGFTVKESYAGLIAEQMFQKIGGDYGVALTILRKGFIEMILKLAHDKSIDYSAFIGEVKKIKNFEEYGFDEAAFVKDIIEKGILEVGFEVRCPVCIQQNWYHLDKLNYELECQKCLSNFRTHVEDPKQIKFAYKAKGTFSLPTSSYGAYTVLLAHHFFAFTLDYPTTPILGVIVKNKNLEFDIDYAVFAKEVKHGFEETLFIISECKTFNSLKSDDINKMKIMGEQMPGSILLFACLKETLDSKEKKLLTALVKNNRAKKKKNKSFNKILILTGHELRSRERPPYCWGNEIRSIPEIEFQRIYDIDSICIASQKIHLQLRD